MTAPSQIKRKKLKEKPASEFKLIDFDRSGIEKLGGIIESARIKACLSLDETEVLTGYSRSTLSNLEQGKLDKINPALIESLVVILRPLDDSGNPYTAWELLKIAFVYRPTTESVRRYLSYIKPNDSHDAPFMLGSEIISKKSQGQSIVENDQNLDLIELVRQKLKTLGRPEFLKKSGIKDEELDSLLSGAVPSPTLYMKLTKILPYTFDDLQAIFDKTYKKNPSILEEPKNISNNGKGL